MKRNSSFVAAAIMLLATCTSPLFAQKNSVETKVPLTTSVSGSVVVQVPFSFKVSEKTFRAGRYAITPVYEKSLAIRSVEGKDSIIVLTRGVTANTTALPKLVFHKYGDSYFLAEAWLRISESGREFNLSKEEIVLARNTAREQVTIIASK